VKKDEHHTPDGRFTLVVKYEDDDVLIGFAGFGWHAHGSVLAANYALGGVSGLTPETATRRFVEDIISNRAVIAVMKTDGTIRDVWITDDIETELRYKQPDEEIGFRYWDGTDARA
jgi:hypothetical protein